MLWGHGSSSRHARGADHAGTLPPVAKAQQARCESRRQQLAAVMQELKAAREAKGLSLADIYERTGMDRSALSKLENVANENPTIDTLLRYAEVVGKRLQIQVVDS